MTRRHPSRWSAMGPVRTGAAVAVLSLALAVAFAQKDTPVTSMDDVLLREQGSVEPVDQGTADHRKFESLQREFATGPDVTRACLECHTEAAKQVMETSHWTWICPRAREELADRHGEEPDRIGKGAHVINNFCIALASNEPRCTSCHAGYGWEDKTFDFEDQTLVDCLVCHDQTGEYKKFPTGAGHPNYEPREWPKGSGNIWQPPNLTRIAQNVGKPTRRNCGVCHFWGGGGEGVKHGDMDATLAKPQRSLDVHMAVDGPDFTCTECHTTRDHKIAGRCFTIPAFEERDYVMRGIRGEFDLMVCESCHSAEPHAASVLNGHTDKVSCEACHIPTMAPLRPTKMWWDWSRAGRMSDQGKPYTETSQIGGVEVPSYDTKKGRFIWALNAEPEYYWFGGDVEHVFQDDVIDDTTPGRDRGVRKGEHDELDLDQPVISINTLIGSYDDPSSRIYPVKVHRGKQPY
ncbi:MAG: tetrathionate reductase family octaheme c-type cytochrome, partial [Armatimonadia bacterium]|nr:tetrathionate reductase family octaheme c-type cytochrome [Armatimonadia bacterium]